MAGGTRRARDMRKALRRLIPLAPLSDAAPILDAALARHLRHLPPSTALWLAITSHVRHRHTGYEALLADGYDRESARFFSLDDMNAVLTRWGAKRLVDAQDDVLEEGPSDEAHAGRPSAGPQR